MQKTNKATTPLFCAMALIGLLGCRIEQNGPHVNHAEQREQKRLNAMITPRELPPPPHDEAELVLQACGTPRSDKVLPIYTQLEHGPVRRLAYAGRQAVTLDFVPSDPEPHAGRRALAYTHPLPSLRAQLPPNTVWEFEVGKMKTEDLLTSERLRVYLPCAAKALQAVD